MQFYKKMSKNEKTLFYLLMVADLLDQTKNDV